MEVKYKVMDGWGKGRIGERMTGEITTEVRRGKESRGRNDDKLKGKEMAGEVNTEERSVGESSEMD